MRLVEEAARREVVPAGAAESERLRCGAVRLAAVVAPWSENKASRASHAAWSVLALRFHCLTLRMCSDKSRGGCVASVQLLLVSSGHKVQICLHLVQIMSVRPLRLPPGHYRSTDACGLTAPDWMALILRAAPALRIATTHLSCQFFTRLECGTFCMD